MKKRIIVGVTGASGAQLALDTLDILAQQQVETHLVWSKGAVLSLTHELGEKALDLLKAKACISYEPDHMMSAIASGSCLTDGMIITPCSMRSLSAVAYSLTDNLLTRAADVTLKERRKLVIVPRETPLHEGHLGSHAESDSHGGNYRSTCASILCKAAHNPNYAQRNCGPWSSGIRN